MVGRYGVGYDVVDVGAARERGSPTSPITAPRKWRRTP